LTWNISEGELIFDNKIEDKQAEKYWTYIYDLLPDELMRNFLPYTFNR